MATAYLKSGTSNVLIVNGNVAIDARCCCEAYYIDLLGINQPLTSGVTSSTDICAFTQYGYFNCVGGCELGPPCIDDHFNGSVDISAFNVIGVTIDFLPSPIHFTNGHGTLLVRATIIPGSFTTSFGLLATPTVQLSRISNIQVA